MDVKIFKAIAVLESAEERVSKLGHTTEIDDAARYMRRARHALTKALGKDLSREGKACISAEVEE